MCCNCGDWIDMCFEPPCVARLGANGIGNPSRAHHFYAGDGVPCEHVLAKHRPECPVYDGSLCDYEGRCDPDFDELEESP